MLLTSIAIGVERFDVRDEHSANFASITQLVFLLMILQHAGEFPEDIARANYQFIQIHGPKIRMVPERIKSEEYSWWWWWIRLATRVKSTCFSKKNGSEQGHDDSAVPNQFIIPVLFLLILWRNLLLCQRAIYLTSNTRYPLTSNALQAPSTP